jgi:hypothetical protein
MKHRISASPMSIGSSHLRFFASLLKKDCSTASYNQNHLQPTDNGTLITKLLTTDQPIPKQSFDLTTVIAASKPFGK